MDLEKVWKKLKNLFLLYLLDSHITDYIVDLTLASTMMGKSLGTH